MEYHKLARFEGNDWLFHLYSGGTEEHYSTPTREPLTKSAVIKVCDGNGRHRKYNKGKGPMWSCDFDDFGRPSPTPSPIPIESPNASGVNLGLAIGIPIGIIGTMALLGLGWYLAPKLRRRLNGEGGIQL